MKKEKLDKFSDKEIRNIFVKFSHPLVSPGDTEELTEKAIALSKILWSAFIMDSDSELELYQLLNKLLRDNNEDVHLFASLYYNEMKPSITKNETQKIKKHYSNKRKYNTLNDVFNSLNFE